MKLSLWPKRRRISALAILVLLFAGSLASYSNCTGSGFSLNSSVSPTSDAGKASQANSGSSSSSTSNPSGVPTPASPSPSPSPSPSGGAPTPNDPNILFADEFDSFSAYDSTTGKGTWQTVGNGASNSQGTSGWGAEFNINPLTQTVGINPFSVANGVLTISTNATPNNLLSQLGNQPYTSGGIKVANQKLGYGYYEIRAQLPAGAGNWPAFWLLPSDGAWPPEIDIYEVLECDPTTIWMTVHSQVNFPNSVTYGPAWAGGPPHYQYGQSAKIADTTAGFHTYGMDYRGDKLTWYVDRVPLATAPTPSDLVNRQMYIVINNAANGGWSCNNTFSSSSIFPTIYQVDYVRVYNARPF